MKLKHILSKSQWDVAAMSNVIPLYRDPNEICHVLRVGHTGHRVIEDLQAGGRMPFRHAVFDASHSRRQIDLISAFSAAGIQVIVDPKAAELANPIGVHSSARRLAWAQLNRVQTPIDWQASNGRRKTEQIAEFVAGIGASAVLAPTHFIDSVDSPWFDTNTRVVHWLREALDVRDCSHVRIDYHLTIPVSMFRDPSEIEAIASQIADTPTANIWLRVSGFGMNGTPAALRRYIEAAWRLDSSVNKPIIADNVGGNVALSLIGFGAVGGICHGAAERESFSVSSWRNRSPGGGGPQSRIYAPALDMFLPRDTAEAFLGGRNAKTLVLCTDESCCRDAEDMLVNSKQHAIIRSHYQIAEIARRPSLSRVDYLLTEILPETHRSLRKARRIKLSDEKLIARLQKLANRSERMLHVLEDLHSSNEVTPIAKTPLGSRRNMKQLG